MIHNNYIVAVAYHSQSHKTITIYITAAEYSYIIEVCCKNIFIPVVIFIVAVVEYPIIVNVGNVGDILLS